MKINTSISINRNSRDKITIRVKDEASCIEFLNLEMSLESFALSITGLSEIECEATIKNLINVGKTKVTEKRSVVCTIKTYDKQTLSQWIANNCREDGWEVNTYLGSQSSVVHKDNTTILNYSVFKYI